MNRKLRRRLYAYILLGFLVVLGIFGFAVGKLTTLQITKQLSACECSPVQEEVQREVVHTSLGEFTITAYCSCEKCCGSWAANRPKDHGGNDIVIGASGETLKPGISVASTLPFGTELYIDGYGGVVVEDRPAAYIAEKYEDKIVDIYFNDHKEAEEFGKYVLEVFIVGQEVHSN